MKKLILLNILSLHFIFLNAQTYYPFPDSNSIWSEATIFYDKTYTTFHQFGLIGDTTINLFNYNKLYYLDDTTLNINNSFIILRCY